MGQVYLGQSPGGRPVAVKVIRADLAGDPDFRARFAREVATARTVSGIFTVPVVDADTDARQPWLVTAYVDGPSLADAVAQGGPFPADRLRALAAGLAEGLEAIHAAGVVHRDLKPSNVLLAPDGPRIIDFGISRAMEGGGLTGTNIVVGSPGFMSPEQATGALTGPPSDIFSLGSVLAFAATGRAPFGSGSSETLLFRVVHLEPDVAGVPDVARPLIQACLTKYPGQRPTAAQIVAGFIPGATDDMAVPPPAPVRPSPVPPPRTQSPAPAETESLAKTWGLAVPAPDGQPWLFGHPSAKPGADRQPTQPGRGNRGQLAVGIAAVAVLVVAGTLTAIAMSRSHSQPGSAAALSSTAWVGTTAAASTSGLPAGWTTFSDPGEFSIGLPAGWAVKSSTSDEINFSGPQPGYIIRVAWTHRPQPDAYADWQSQSTGKSSDDPGYHLIGITRVDYRGWNTADWEFVDTADGGLDHYLDRGFIVKPGQLGFAIEILGPDANWTTVQPTLWPALTQTFQPG